MRCILACFLCACSTAAAPDVPIDASPIPTSAAGTFTVHTVLDLPLANAPVIADFVAATDDPDDPSRYLVDRLVAALPDGQIKTVAKALAPYVAADLNAKLASCAPDFAPGMRALADGLARIAHRFDTTEELVIARDGSTTRTVTGVRFDKLDVELAAAGVADAQASMRTELDPTGRLVIGDHVIGLPYAAILRLGFDRAVVPTVDPTAPDVARALLDLVDCGHVGTAVADSVGIGDPALYAAACEAGLTKLAHDFYARLAAVEPIALDTRGTARATDGDRDAAMDGFDDGTWTGAVVQGDTRVPLSARFAGSER